MTDFPHLLVSTDSGPRPTVAIVGVGAIGTVVADALSERAAVTLCRRDSVEPMSIQLGTLTHRVDAAVAGSPEGLTPVDWVVVTVKAQDTSAIGPWLDALVGPQTTVVVLQNGIGHAERVSEWVAATQVVPGVVYIAAEKVGGNLVVCRRRGAVAIGGAPASVRFAALFGESVDVRVVDDFVTESWNKLVINAALNTVTALTDSTMEITADAGVRPLVRALLAEAVEVARAEGAVMPEGSAALILDHMDSLPRAGATSMLLDRRAGRALEHDYLTGAVIAAADRHGLAVPMLRMVHGLIDALDPRDRSAVHAVSLAA
ncbi:2-dehydropantoate 2-reductase [Conyzicola nivalis]|uniref:2-dehydropantoate 2-reductase n=1 Tax=Conyzicola nivalis TaxID=1477021 RepID=A0ABV2QQL8_9MICO